jgi:putative spermidine/putrescine transport system ATP-binding protein
MLPPGAELPAVGSTVRLAWSAGDVHYMDDAA